MVVNEDGNGKFTYFHAHRLMPPLLTRELAKPSRLRMLAAIGFIRPYLDMEFGDDFQ